MAKKSAPKSFEDAIARLEAITQSMQNNAQPLEEALENYAEGVELVRYCQQKTRRRRAKNSSVRPRRFKRLGARR